MIPERYTLSKAIKAIQNPHKFAQEAVYLYNQLGNRVNTPFYQAISDEGESFIDEDWDNLIILDACRYDWFHELNTIEGELIPKVSPASESWEFMQESFVGRELHDTVYITSNPYANKIPDQTFHSIINLLNSHWNDEYHTVLPETIVEQTLLAQERYPSKRIISHFMQPHFPFIGKRGENVNHAGIEQPLPENKKTEAKNPWTYLNQYGRSDRAATLEAYRENHAIAIKHAELLIDQLSGKSVITADHANLLGEWTWPIPKRQYGHPRGFRKAELVTVPWLVVDSDDRRDISAEPPERQDKLESEIVEDRLYNLGYT